MKKIFVLRRRRDLSTTSGKQIVGNNSSNNATSRQAYQILDKDLGMIHKAAVTGNVTKVKQSLLLRINGVNDRDKKNRTALHLACANGHAAVVTLLAKKKCMLNLGDNENSTALMKAVQSQHEECATILLDRGADPNIMDIDGNTALHYAVLGQNTAIVAKLLSHKANIGARNRKNRTALSLAVGENRKQIEEYLEKEGTEVKLLERNHLVTFAWQEEGGFDMSSESSKSLVNEKSEKASSRSIPCKSTANDSETSLDDEDSDFCIKGNRKRSLRNLLAGFPQFQKPVEVKPSLAMLLAGFPAVPKREEATKPEIKKKGNGRTPVLRLGKDEDTESPWDSESFSASFPQKCNNHLPEASNQGGKIILNRQKEDSPENDSCLKPTVAVKHPVPKKAVEMNFVQTSTSEVTSGKEEERLVGNENNHAQVVEEQSDTQKQLSQEQNASISQGGISTSHLCKQNEIQIAHEKINSEVSGSSKKGKKWLRENHMLAAKVAKLTLEIDTVKNQNQEMEKKYLEDIAIIKESNDFLQKTIELNEATFTRTISEYSGQLNVLTAENRLLKSKLDTEKQNKERLETEVESYRFRLATAGHDLEQSETMKRDLLLDFQRAKNEWLHLQDKMNCDISDLKNRNEILSQQLSKAESKFNSLDIELHEARDALREKILVLEDVQRDLSLTQCQKKQAEHMYQKEQSKVNKYIEKQGSLEERLSQLQSEIVLLRQQLDDANNKADNKEKAAIDMKDHLQDIIEMFHVKSESQAHLLNERNKELIKECNNLRERMHQCENDKAERDVALRNLLQEVANSLKKQSMSESSLQFTSHSHMNVEDETQEIKRKLGQIQNQLQEAQDQYAAIVKYAEETQDKMQKLEIENTKLKVTVQMQGQKIEQFQKNLLGTNLSQDEKEQLKKYIELKGSLEYSLDEEKEKNGESEKETPGFQKLLKNTKKKLNEYENGEFSCPGDLKRIQTEMDTQINVLKYKNDALKAKLETVSSKCLNLDEKNKFLQQELLSMKAMQKKYEKLKDKKKDLKQEIVNLKSHMVTNTIWQEFEKTTKKDLL